MVNVESTNRHAHYYLLSIVGGLSLSKDRALRTPPWGSSYYEYAV